jgi:hypothetical protein
VLSVLILLGSSCKKEYITQQTIVQPPPAGNEEITRFWFDPENNSSFLHDVVELEVNGNTISGRIPFYTSLKTLVPSFVSTNDTVMVGAELQESGVSKQDFSHPLSYKVSSSKGEADYTVNLINFTGQPVIQINTVDHVGIVSKDDYVNAHITIDGAGIYDDFDGDIKIKGRGNSTWGLPKKPYKFKLDKKQSLLGEPQDKEWVLLANYTDKTQLRNATALYMGQISALDWTPHAHYAELFLNDVYQGTYQLCESIKVAGTRVNVSDDGYLLEVDQASRLEPGDVFFTTTKMLLNIKEPELSTGDEKFKFIQNYLLTAESTLFGNNFTDPESGYRKYLDVASFVDWYLINEITKNNDAVFFSSCYMNLAPNGKLKMGPIWDFDIALGNINYNDNNSSQGFWIKNASWINRLFQDPAFVNEVKERFAFFKSKKNEILNNINANAASLKWSALENNGKWQTLYTNTWPNYAVWGSYDNEVIYMKNWFNARMDWLETAIAEL